MIQSNTEAATVETALAVEARDIERAEQELAGTIPDEVPETKEEKPEAKPEEAEAEATEEAETEEPEASEAEDETEEAEAEAEEQKPDKAAHGYEKRIGKLTKRAKEAEAEIARLKSELAEKEGKLATTPDAETLAKSGLAAGYATAEEAKVVSEDGELAQVSSWLRNDKQGAIAAIRKQYPDATDEEVSVRYMDWRESIQEKRLLTASRAQAIRDRVAAELKADIEAARAAKAERAKAKTPAATKTAGTVKAKSKPLNVAASGTGLGGGVARPGSSTKPTRESFKERAKQIGEMDAAAEALASYTGV